MPAKTILGRDHMHRSACPAPDFQFKGHGFEPRLYRLRSFLPSSPSQRTVNTANPKHARLHTQSEQSQGKVKVTLSNSIQFKRL